MRRISGSFYVHCILYIGHPKSPIFSHLHSTSYTSFMTSKMPIHYIHKYVWSIYNIIYGLYLEPRCISATYLRRLLAINYNNKQYSIRNKRYSTVAIQHYLFTIHYPPIVLCPQLPPNPDHHSYCYTHSRNLWQDVDCSV